MKLANYYPAEVEEAMKKHYDTLTEKDKRQYAAVEAMKLGYGGQRYIVSILGCDRKTIYNGIKEEVKISNRIRKKGGGRKKIIDITAQIDEIFLKVLENHTAGNPMDDSIIWTDLTDSRTRELLEKEGIKVSRYVVQQLFKKHNFKQRKMQKTVTMKQSENRNEQFENIAILKQKYINSSNNPVISMDVKKRRL